MRRVSWGSWWMAVMAAAALTAAGCSHKSVDDYLNAGDNAMQNTQLPQAEKDYTEAVKLAPNDSRTHIALGNLYIFEQKTDQARAEFMKVLDIDPKNAAAHA
ncbi:MAG: tetratricopeptide repeat protein, partial [Candidatus Binataceae bacterium]